MTNTISDVSCRGSTPFSIGCANSFFSSSVIIAVLLLDDDDDDGMDTCYDWDNRDVTVAETFKGDTIQIRVIITVDLSLETM